MMKRVVLAVALLACFVVGGVRLELVAQDAVVEPAIATNSQRTPRESLRFDDKGFDEWSVLLGTELSPVRRRHAVEALTEFGVHGYGHEVAELLVGLFAQQATDSGSGTAHEELRTATRRSIHRLDPQFVVPLLANLVENRGGDVRTAAIWTCHEMGPRAVTAATAILGVAADQNQPTGDRELAILSAGKIIPSDQRLIETCLGIMKDPRSPSTLLVNAVQSLSHGEALPHDERLLLSTADLLQHPDRLVRETAKNSLAACGQQIESVLPELLHRIHRFGREAKDDKDLAANEASRFCYQTLVEHAGLHSAQPLQNCVAGLAGEDRLLVVQILIEVSEYKNDPNEMREMLMFFRRLSDGEDEEIAKRSRTTANELSARLRTVSESEDSGVYARLKAANEKRQRQSGASYRGNSTASPWQPPFATPTQQP